MHLAEAAASNWRSNTTNHILYLNNVLDYPVTEDAVHVLHSNRNYSQNLLGDSGLVP